MTSTAMMIGLKGKSSTSNPGGRMWWATGNIVALILVALSLFGCSPSDAKPPQHVLEIGDPVLVRSSFNSIEQCEQFVNRLIVVLHKAKSPIPENMRCQ